MIKSLLMLLVLHVSLVGDMLYTVNGTLVGKVMEIRVKHKEDKSKYSTELVIKSAGLLKVMTGGQVEHYSSKGFMRNGELYSKEYRIDKNYKNIRHIKRYLFDYKSKKITKITKKWKNGKKLYDKKETLKYFAHNDVLTIYKNILRYKKKNKSGRYTVSLAGAEKDGGKISFVLPKGKELARYQKNLGTAEVDIVSLKLKQSFFSNSNGTLLLGIDREGITQKGLLNNVKLLGKVTLKRIK